MHDIAQPSTSVKHADGSCCHDPSISETVRLGQEALERKRRGWADWIAIGEALLAGRAEVMRDTHTNVTAGRRYEKAMAEWLVVHGFKEIDKRVRSRLLECLQHRIEIDQWLSQLTEGERFRFNHPDTVLRRWRRSTVVPDPNATPKSSPFGRLKDAHAELAEENRCLRQKNEAADGDLWKSTDTAEDIAGVIVATLSLAKAERTAREILKRVKERKAIKPKGRAS